ncbi:hypothetical protein BGZ80_010751 [Entomortierella chlamydospora]|uniref:Uncharacterized protein n=1 Tax=Entomortierella chlamydospora TaxID=101097 RepID=A0A9P6SZS7_9FUNG|nr:hypothetical protein BGZ80_010751 [Entomortierella chlamydospora]
MPGPRLAPEGNTSLFGATYLAFFSETQLRYGSLCQGNKKKKELLQEAAFAFKEYNIRGRKVDLLFQTVYKNHKDKENLRLNKTLLANLRRMDVMSFPDFLIKTTK